MRHATPGLIHSAKVSTQTLQTTQWQRSPLSPSAVASRLLASLVALPRHLWNQTQQYCMPSRRSQMQGLRRTPATPLPCATCASSAPGVAIYTLIEIHWALPAGVRIPSVSLWPDAAAAATQARSTPAATLQTQGCENRAHGATAACRARRATLPAPQPSSYPDADSEARACDSQLLAWYEQPMRCDFAKLRLINVAVASHVGAKRSQGGSNSRP